MSRRRPVLRIDMPLFAPFFELKSWSRWVVVFYLMIWLSIGGYCWVYWAEMSFGVKVIFSVLEMFFAPDLNATLRILKGRAP